MGYNIFMNAKINAALTAYWQTLALPQASLLVFGSALDEGWTPESDVDLFLIDDWLKTDVERREILGVELEIQKDNLAQLVRDLEDERGNLQNRNLATMLASARILRPGEHDLAALQAQAREVLASDTKYSEADVRAWQESIADYLGKCRRDLRRGDATAFQLDSSYVVQNLLDLFLAQHNGFLPQPKHLAAKLQELDPDFAENFAKMAQAGALADKLELLEQLAQKV